MSRDNDSRYVLKRISDIDIISDSKKFRRKDMIKCLKCINCNRDNICTLKNIKVSANYDNNCWFHKSRDTFTDGWEYDDLDLDSEIKSCTKSNYSFTNGFGGRVGGDYY